jgi:competence protein ComEC
MRLRDASPLWGTFHRGTSLVAGAAATTLVAGTAIAPFALYHFHRMTHYGLVANLLAAPLVSVLIMPMALLSLAAMPFGLEFWPLQVMGAGIDLMVATGEWVASWPGAVSILPQISGLALVLIVLGGLWLCLWQTRARMLGLVIAAFGIALAPQTERPDVLIERGGDTAALRSDAGSLVFPPATAASYSAEKWLLADGDERDVANATDDTVFRCDTLGCIGVVKGKTVALIRHPGALEEDCRLADIVIAPFTIGKKCRAARVIVDRRMLKAQGAHALFIEELSIRTETVAAARGQRPWVPNRAIVPAMRRTSPDTGGNQDGAVRDPRGEGNPDE